MGMEMTDKWCTGVGPSMRKQLFAEKMVTACFMDPNKVAEWDGNIKASVLNQREFAEIWEDRGRIDVSMGVSASTWFDAERRQSIESGAQGDSIAEHASVTWQDFDVALTMEPYYVTMTKDIIGSKSTSMLRPSTAMLSGRHTTVTNVATLRTLMNTPVPHFSPEETAMHMRALDVLTSMRLRTKVSSAEPTNLLNGKGIAWPQQCTLTTTFCSS